MKNLGGERNGELEARDTDVMLQLLLYCGGCFVVRWDVEAGPTGLCCCCFSFLLAITAALVACVYCCSCCLLLLVVVTVIAGYCSQLTIIAA